MFKFWSYKREFKKYKKDLLSVISKSIESGTIFFGGNLHTFEKRFNSKYKSRYGIAVGSGTDALLISLKAIGVKNGDEVITAANTAIPTISAIVNTGAKPVFVDINEKDYLIDVNRIEQKITSKTKAIIPVHLYGQSAEMNKILKISKKYKLHIIEDCAQAQGAKYKNKFVGNFGTFGCFSFYPTKILGAYGDGGFIFTQNYDLYKKIKRIRFYGIETIDKKNNYFNQYYANENGINSRLDEIQSSILNYKLKKVDTAINRRRQLAKIYLKELKATSLKLPSENKDNKHVYHLFTIYHDKMNKIRILLEKNNIETRVIYPYPVHLMKAYSKFNTTNEKFVNSEKYAKGIFCIPLYPEITDNQAYNLCNKIKLILKKNNI